MVNLSMIVIDDDLTNVNAVRVRLSGIVGVAVSVVHADSISSARAILAGSQFDVAVLDVALPQFSGESARSRGGVDLLKELQISTGLNTPATIIGVTSHGDDFEALRREFEKCGWSLQKRSHSSFGWLESVERLVRSLAASRSSRVHKADVVVINALYDPEFESVMALPWSWSGSEHLDETTIVRRGTLVVGDRSLSVFATWSNRMGLVSTAALASKMIQMLRPRVIASSGVCGGVSGKVRMGEAIFASEAWTWESGKVVDVPKSGTREPDPHSVSASPAMTVIAQGLQGEQAWIDSALLGWRGSRPEGANALVVGPMASGSAVVADQSTVDVITSSSRKTIGIDMEAYALYMAALHAGCPEPKALCVKTVCDFANSKKTSEWQSFAARKSALIMERILTDAVLAGVV